MDGYPMPSDSSRDEAVARLIATVRRVTGDPASGIALHEPRFAGREWDYVKDCLDSGWVSSVGAYVDRFEAGLAEACGVRHAVAVVNGTAALHLAMIVAGVTPGDEVLVPALTFVATANAVSHAGAVPHLVDSAEDTLGLCPVRLAAYLDAVAERRDGHCYNRGTGRRIAAVVPMHVFGIPVAMDALTALAADWGIPVVEDAAEALGSRYHGRPAGSLGLVAALSFNGNKIMTTGGGGAVLTDDPEIAARAKRLSTTAKKPHRWAFDHDEVAFNYRLPNINAALGCAQLEQLPGFLAAKRRLAARYQAAFAGVNGARIVTDPPGSESNYWLNALLLDEGLADCRDALLQQTNDAGLMTRPVWGLMHRQPMYRNCPQMDLAVAESLARRLVNLPSSVVLGLDAEDR